MRQGSLHSKVLGYHGMLFLASNRPAPLPSQRVSLQASHAAPGPQLMPPPLLEGNLSSPGLLGHEICSGRAFRGHHGSTFWIQCLICVGLHGICHIFPSQKWNTDGITICDYCLMFLDNVSKGTYTSSKRCTMHLSREKDTHHLQAPV